MASAGHPLAQQWRELLSDEPGDWSHLALELRLADQDQSERAVVICGPLNPWLGDQDYRSGVLRFSAARTAGYGAAAGLVGARLALMDEAGIGGTLRLLRSVDAARLVASQGPIL